MDTMEDKDQEQVQEQVQGQDDQMSQLKAQLLEEVKGEVKTEIAGLNRKISELTKEKQEVEEAARKEAEAKRTVSERISDLEKMVIDAQKATEAEKVRNEMTKLAMEKMSERGLPADLVKKIDISSIDSMEADIDYFSTLTQSIEKDIKDGVRKKHAFSPTGGEAKHSVPKSLAECKTKEDKIAYLHSLRG